MYLDGKIQFWIPAPHLFYVKKLAALLLFDYCVASGQQKYRLRKRKKLGR